MWHWAVGAAGHLCLPSGPSHAPRTVVPPSLGRAIGQQHPLYPLSPENVPWGGELGDGVSFGVHSPASAPCFWDIVNFLLVLCILMRSLTSKLNMQKNFQILR